MQYGDFLTQWSAQMRNNPRMRPGQVLFNTLYSLRPDLANAIRGRFPIDPFHSDEHIGNCLTLLGEVWGCLPDNPHPAVMMHVDGICRNFEPKKQEQIGFRRDEKPSNAAVA